MDLAFLIALLLAVALGVAWLRTAADRDRWRDEAELQSTVVVKFGTDFSRHAARQRAHQTIDKARAAKRRK